MTPLITAENLAIAFDGKPVVHDVSFTLRAGSCLGIVGESGSGKSVTARSLLGLNGENATVTGTTLEIGGEPRASADLPTPAGPQTAADQATAPGLRPSTGPRPATDLLTATEEQFRRLRGSRLGYVLQDALVSLDPIRRVGSEIAEPLRLHGVPRAERPARVRELLSAAGVPEPELRARQLPGELSGGLRQRALIAAALALDPEILIADEPTTALDVTVQAEILALLEDSLSEGRAIILISHDLAVVERLADHVLVMKDGRVVEQGPTSEVLSHPQHPYTQRLIAAVPSAHSRGDRLSDAPPQQLLPARTSPPERSADANPLLSVQRVSKRYRGPDGRDRTVVDDVSFDLHAGETLGIVGESGSGKSTTAWMSLALIRPTAGTVLLNGLPWSELPERKRRASRRGISVVHQDSLGSFDPRWTAGRIIADALPPDIPRSDRARRVGELLDSVGLAPEHVARHPRSLSGGQRQRVSIARALATDPEILVLDEPVSALDVSIQAQVLDLLGDLQQALGTAYLFISHDLGVIHHMSDRVLVMQGGRIVESGTADAVFFTPQHDYTRQLVDALPRPRLEESA